MVYPHCIPGAFIQGYGCWNANSFFWNVLVTNTQVSVNQGPSNTKSSLQTMVVELVHPKKNNQTQQTFTFTFNTFPVPLCPSPKTVVGFSAKPW